MTSSDGTVAARALVRFSKGQPGVHSSTHDEITHLLIIERDGAKHEVELTQISKSAVETTLAQFRSAASAEMKLAFAPDGHAIAVSTDGGTTHRHVVLDAGAPFLCGVGQARESAATRDLVLEAVKAEGFYTHVAFTPERSCDIRGLTRVMCKSSGDTELWNAAVARFVDHELVDSERYPLLRCMQNEARSNVDVRATLVAGTKRTPEEVGNAAEALAKTADVEVQRALAAALRALLEAPGDDKEACWARAKAAWSLASITVDRKDAPNEVRALFADVGRGVKPCEQRPIASFERVYAVAALAALRADAPLAELASKCTGAAAALAVPFEHWNEAGQLELGGTAIECFAKGATLRP